MNAPFLRSSIVLTAASSPHADQEVWVGLLGVVIISIFVFIKLDVIALWTGIALILLSFIPGIPKKLSTVVRFIASVITVAAAVPIVAYYVWLFTKK